MHAPPLFLGDDNIFHAAVVDGAADAVLDYGAALLLLLMYWIPRGVHTCILVRAIDISCVTLSATTPNKYIVRVPYTGYYLWIVAMR